MGATGSLETQELLTGKENIEIGIHCQIKFLTVEDLFKIGLVLLKSEFSDGKIPTLILPAFAIEVLTKRAIEKGLSIY